MLCNLLRQLQLTLHNRQYQCYLFERILLCCKVVDNKKTKEHHPDRAGGEAILESTGRSSVEGLEASQKEKSKVKSKAPSIWSRLWCFKPAESPTGAKLVEVETKEKQVHLMTATTIFRLRLKGRVFVNHISCVEAYHQKGQLCSLMYTIRHYWLTGFIDSFEIRVN